MQNQTTRKELIDSLLKRCRKSTSYFSKVITPIATLFFSIAALITANNISKEQLRISKLQMNPKFSIESELSKDEGSDKFNNEILYIKNNGYPITNYSFSHEDFIEISKRTQGITKTVLIPTNYYINAINYGNDTGVLNKLWNNNNNSYFIKIYHEVSEYNNDSFYYEVKLVSHFKLSFLNADGDNEEVYYIDKNKVTKEIYDRKHKMKAKTLAMPIDKINIKDILNSNVI
ncbi:TPA: hypothetical protein ACQ30S_000087 [Yersinia enterocolitica]